jgi:hypothetical protein
MALRRIWGFLAVMAGGLAPLVVLGAPASIAAPAASASVLDYGPTYTCTISVNPTTVAPGQSFTVTITCTGTVPPNDRFTITLSGDPGALGTLTLGANGSGSATFVAPAGSISGQHVVAGTDGTVTVATNLDISPPLGAGQGTVTTVAVAASHSSSNLAFTGADVAITSAVAAAAVGAGGLLVLTVRRRRVAR